MSQVIPFESAKLPAYLSKVGAPVNDDLTTGIGGGYPVLSIKGKVFTLVKDKERTVIRRPDDPDEAATSLELVLLKANKAMSKVWYEFGYEDGSNAKPDCSSNDGTAPDAGTASPQAKTCAACPRNVWGSGKDGKGKSCQDSRRLAVTSAGQLNEPMLLRVPPASLKNLAEYGKMLSNRGVPYTAVVTKVRFDVEEATPKLVFTPVSMLTEEQYNDAMAVANSDLVSNIIGVGGAHVAEESFETEAPAPKPAAKAAPKAAPKPAEPAPKPAVKEVVDAPAANFSAADDDLDAMLGELDG